MTADGEPEVRTAYRAFLRIREEKLSKNASAGRPVEN